MITLSGRVINADGDPQRCTIVAKPLPESVLDLSNNLVYYGDVTRATDEQGYFSLRLKNGPGIAYTIQTKGQHYLPQGLVLDGDLPDGTNVKLSDLKRREGTPLPPTLEPLEGPAGPSAYEVAVAAGFEGTEAEWVASLAGRGVVSIVDDDKDGTASVTWTDGTTSSLLLPEGQPGEDAPLPDFTLVADPLPEGATPTSAVEGTYPDLTLRVGIPKGDKGDPGVGIPQTLSLTGSDLTLSDGGGTVTLPSGGGGAVSSVNGATGAVVLDADDVGALPSTYTPPAQSWTQITGKPETFAPTAHAVSHATGGSDPITPESIGAATAAQGTKADSAVQPVDVDDVIREGDTRLTDARTPTAHGHAYSEITGTPTIPGPQTLSLDGPDLSLSGGGGTVTLPSGGGSTTPPFTAFSATAEWRPPMTQGNATTTYTNGLLVLYPIPVPAPITLTGLSAMVMGSSASGLVHIGIYTDAGFRPGSLVTSVTDMPAAVTGVVAKSVTAVTLPPGLYWLGGLATGADVNVQGTPTKEAFTSPWVTMPQGTGSAPTPATGNSGVTAHQSGLSALPATASATPQSHANGPRPLATWWKVAAA